MFGSCLRGLKRGGLGRSMPCGGIEGEKRVVLEGKGVSRTPRN